MTGKKFERIYASSEDYLEERRARSEQGDLDIREEILTALGLTRANWVEVDTFANKYLGLEDENIEALISDVRFHIGTNRMSRCLTKSIVQSPAALPLRTDQL